MNPEIKKILRDNHIYPCVDGDYTIPLNAENLDAIGKVALVLVEDGHASSIMLCNHVESVFATDDEAEKYAKEHESEFKKKIGRDFPDELHSGYTGYFTTPIFAAVKHNGGDLPITRVNIDKYWKIAEALSKELKDTQYGKDLRDEIDSRDSQIKNSIAKKFDFLQIEKNGIKREVHKISGTHFVVCYPDRNGSYPVDEDCTSEREAQLCADAINKYIADPNSQQMPSGNQQNEQQQSAQDTVKKIFQRALKAIMPKAQGTTKTMRR